LQDACSSHRSAIATDTVSHTQEVRLTLIEARKAENSALGVQTPLAQVA
jgi:hypothetical protein